MSSSLKPEFPQLYCPFPSSVNPHRAEVSWQTLEWALRLRLIDASALAHLTVSDPGGLAAHVYPDSDVEALQLASDWITWLFIVDDYFDQADAGRNPASLGCYLSRLTDRLVPHPSSPDADCDDPAVNALSDLVRRSYAASSTESWSRLRSSVAEYLAACLWESTNRASGQPLDLDTYTQMRVSTGAMMVVFHLADVTDGVELSDAVRGLPAIARLTTIAANVVCWTNDILSVHKEMALGDLHNLVLVLHQTRNIALDDAIQATCGMIEREVLEFIDIERHELGSDRPCRLNLARYLSMLRNWMRGHIDWARGSGRFAIVEEQLDSEKAKGRKPAFCTQVQERSVGAAV